jgi:uncharacterized low-complexity protein
MLARASLIVAALTGAALLAAPAMAQTGDKAKPMAATQDQAGGKKVAAKKRHTMSCYDYAWESQAMKDCLAKQPSGAEPAAAPKKSPKKAAPKKT